MVNIAIVHSVAKIGGAERVSQMLLGNIDTKRFNCVLITPEQGPLTDWAKEMGISHTQIDLNQPGISNFFESIKQAFSLSRYLLKNKIDIVHTADPYCTRACVVGALLARAKVVSHFHFPFEKSHLAWLLRRLPKPSASVFCSQDLNDEVGTHLKELVPEMTLHTIHNGVDVERFCPTNRVGSETLSIGIVANLQKRKGHDEFLEMASLLSKKYASLEFHIIGGDILEEPREHYLKSKAKDLEVDDIVTFHGQVSDVLALLDSLDIVVCASHKEAFPIAILEAMAMQKAIVSTDVNGIPEAIEDNVSGLLTSPFIPDELAQKVSLLIDDPAFRYQLAKNARNRVVEQFNKETFVRKFENFYLNV